MVRDDRAADFPLCTYCCIPPQLSVACANHPSAFIANEPYHVIITTTICVNSMARRLEGWKWSGGSMGSLSVFLVRAQGQLCFRLSVL
jgi:hypothetical protein